MQTQSLIERHLAEAEAALVALDKQRNDLTSEIAALRELLSRRRPEPPPDKSDLNGFPYHLKRLRYEDAIAELLRNSGEKHRKHILSFMKQKGVIGSERDPLANISTILSTSSKFKSMGNGIWALADEEEQRPDLPQESETKRAE